MLHRAHRTWTPYVDPLPDKENALAAAAGLPLKTPVRPLGAGKHHTVNGKASLVGKQAAAAGSNGSQTVKGKEKAGAPMTVFKDRNLVLTGKKNGVSVRGSTVEGDTFGIKKLEFKPAGTTSASTKPKSKLCQQLALPSPADDGFSAPQQTPFMASHGRTSLGGVESTPLPSATRSRRRSRHSFTPLRPSPQQADQAREMASTPAPVRMAPGSGSGGPSSFRFPSSSSVSNLLAPAALDNKSFITPARPSYRAYLSPPEYEMDGEDEDISGRDESFEMGEMRNRMGALGVVDENEGEMMMDAEVQGAEQTDAAVESDGEVEYMPPKVVALPDEIPFDFVPLKTLGQQLNQIRSDFVVADSDSDDEAYPYVERLWNLELGKQELLLGGWEGDEEVRNPMKDGMNRLAVRPDTEFHNPLFAGLKINQARIAKREPAATSTHPTRRPMTATGRKAPLAQQTRLGSNTASGQHRPPTLARRPVVPSAAKQTAPRPLASTAQTRPRSVPMTRLAPTVRSGPIDGAKPRAVDHRASTVRPVLGQTRANVRPLPGPEPLLMCEDVGFEL